MDKELKKKYEEKSCNKETYIERIFDKLFFALNRDIKVTFLVLLVILNVFIFLKYIGSLEARMEDSEVYRDRMIKEIRSQVAPMIEKNIQEKTDRIEKKVDSTSKSIDQLQKSITKAIEKL